MWQACYNQEIEKLRFLLSQPKAQKLHKLATAGPDYECLYAKIGSNCMANDGGVWSKIGYLNQQMDWLNFQSMIS